jgi:hypothetical protein
LYAPRSAAAVHGTNLDLTRVDDDWTTIEQSHFPEGFSRIGGDIVPRRVSTRGVIQYVFSPYYGETGWREQDVIELTVSAAATDPGPECFEKILWVDG